MLSRLVFQNISRQSVRPAARYFSQSVPALAVDIEAEKRCRELLDTLPKFEYLFQNEDGSKRTPSEPELKTIAFLNQYSNERSLTWLETFFTFPRAYEDLYIANDKDLVKLQTSSALIIDKIPFEDTATGEIKWKIVREGEDKEGWENLAHTLFIPAFVFLAITLAWRDDMDVTEWAKRELLYRIKSQAQTAGDVEVLNAFKKYGDEPESYKFDLAGFDKNDDIIVERILSGEYDKLAKLKVNQTKAVAAAAAAAEETASE